jgi:peptidoglycan hydrolase CwlO-like protein
MLKSRNRLDVGGIALIVSIIVVLIVVAALVFHFISRREPTEIKNFQELVKHVEKLNTQISERESKISEMVQKYNASHPDGRIDTTGMAASGLSPEQAQLLASKVSQEKDISYKGLLQNVLDLNKDLDKLSQELQEVKSRLRPPYTVKKGDSHFQVCINFLTQDVGLSEEEAMNLVEKEALTPELLPGFEVWNYYGDGVFGTFVTQGTAKISPNELQRSTKRKIDSERKNLIEARNQKESEVQDLQSKRDELNAEIKNLEKERADMMAQMQEMASKNEKLATQLNSMSFTVNTFRELEKSGVIRKPTLGKWEVQSLETLPGERNLDLRSDNRIAFTAGSLGLSKISKIVLFPRYLDENVDFKVILTEDKQSATVVLQKVEKFKMARIAIAVDQ